MNSNLKIVTGILALVVILGGGYLLLNNDKDDKAIVTNTTNNVTNSTNKTTEENAETPEANAIEISDFAFSPAILTVKVGTTVTWTNKGSSEHTVTADVASSDAPNSDTIGSGKTFSYTFNKTGTYPYHCKFHTSMQASVVVTDQAGI